MNITTQLLFQMLCPRQKKKNSAMKQPNYVNEIYCELGNVSKNYAPATRNGLRRWSAVVIGMIGVVVMLRPGEESLRLVALLPILAAATYSTMQMITRRLGATDRASTMAFYVHH